MKKSVIILITLIYVLSIALVSFFGLKAKTFNEIVYTTGIELLDENIKQNAEGEKYIVIHKDENGEYKYQLKYRVHPDNATNSDVTYSYDTELSYVSVDEDGVVTFTRGGRTATITIIAKDGSGASATLTITAR